MAALLCQAMAKPCEWLGRCCESMCNSMAKCCGHLCKCCDKLCSAMGRACNQCCAAMGECAAGCCSLFEKPFSGVVFLSVLMSLVPLGALVYFLGNGWGANGCSKRLDEWLLIALILFGLNFFFALYLYKKLSKENWADPAQNPKFDPNQYEEVNQHRHASHFFLYDPLVCVYIVLGTFELIWVRLPPYPTCMLQGSWATGRMQDCKILIFSLWFH
jgi:hypothetical protein